MPRRATDREKLLHGPYRSPALRRDDRAFCLFKDCDVVITGWTDARFSWPKCRPVDVPLGRPSILVDEELARAVRHESAAAVKFWWGVNTELVWRWRLALGVTRTNNEGTHRLMRVASNIGASRTRGRKLSPEQVEIRRQNARELDLGQFLQPGYHGPWWTAEEIALLGCMPDDEVARRTSRTVNAVRQKREKLGRSKPGKG
jgi:hypothetical protein